MANTEVSSVSEGQKPGFFYGYVIVLASFFVMVMTYGTTYSFGVFLKPVSAEFGWTRAMTSGAYSLYQILHGLLSIFTGRLSDRFGPRLVVTVCGLSLGLGYLLTSQINAIWQLYLYYGVLVSLGMSSGFIPVTSATARWFVKRRGLMTGIVVSGIGVGTVVIPPLAGQLISSYSWSVSYLIIGGVALGVIVTAAQFLRRDPGKMGLSPYGGNEVKEEGLDLEVRGFSLREALMSRRFWILTVVVLLFLFSQQVIMVHIVPHATDLGIAAVSAAGILSVVGGASIAGRIGMGSASDRIGTKRALIIGLILQSVALISLVGAKELWMFYLLAAIYGFGYGTVITLQSPVVAELFGLSLHGAILGMVIFGATIGGALGPFVVGMIFDRSASYQPGFVLCAVLSVIAVILALLLKYPRKV